MIRSLVSGLAAVFLTASAAVADAPTAPESILAALISSERAGFSGVPSAHLARLSSVTGSGEVAASLHTDAWLAAQPVASGGPQWQCLTEALYFEARGESAEGLFAVAEVILNRVESAAYPSTVCDVVNQGTGRKFACQFTFTCDGKPEEIGNRAAWNRVGKVARAMLDGAPRSLTDGAVYYHTTSVAPSWSRTQERTAAIGVHYFYR